MVTTASEVNAFIDPTPESSGGTNTLAPREGLMPEIQHGSEKARYHAFEALSEGDSSMPTIEGNMAAFTDATRTDDSLDPLMEL